MTTPTSVTIRMPVERNLDKQIDLCRLGARKDNVTVIIERTVERRDGTLRLIPLLEITPHGDIREVDAPRLRVSLLEHLLDANANRYYGTDYDMNAAARSGHEAIANLVKITADYIDAAREEAQARRATRGARRTRRVNTKKANAGRRVRDFAQKTVV